MVELKPCPFCGGAAEIRMVGDWKQYFAAFCSECFRTPVPCYCAAYTKYGAAKEWNRRIDIGNGRVDKTSH